MEKITPTFYGLQICLSLYVFEIFWYTKFNHPEHVNQNYSYKTRHKTVYQNNIMNPTLNTQHWNFVKSYISKWEMWTQRISSKVNLNTFCYTKKWFYSLVGLIFIFSLHYATPPSPLLVIIHIHSNNTFQCI